MNRVKYLIEGYKVRPEEILVVTFYRFAAAEMRSRLCSLMGKETSGDDRGHFMGFIMESFDGLTGSDRRICSRIMKISDPQAGDQASETGDFLMRGFPERYRF